MGDYYIIRDGKKIELTHAEVCNIFRKKDEEYYAEDLTSRYCIPDHDIQNTVESFVNVLEHSDAYFEAYWDAVDYTCKELGYQSK